MCVTEITQVREVAGNKGSCNIYHQPKFVQNINKIEMINHVQSGAHRPDIWSREKQICRNGWMPYRGWSSEKEQSMLWKQNWKMFLRSLTVSLSKDKISVQGKLHFWNDPFNKSIICARLTWKNMPQ